MSKMFYQNDAKKFFVDYILYSFLTVLKSRL